MIESVSDCGAPNGIVNSTEVVIIDDDSKFSKVVYTQLVCILIVLKMSQFLEISTICGKILEWKNW